MNEGLTRVREFAQACGCTPQNIYGHLKTYAADLEGHIFPGKGRQGVLLDEYARDFLKSVMYPKELSADASGVMEQLNTLRGEYMMLGARFSELSARLSTTEAERDRALFDANQYQKLLGAAEDEKAAREEQHAAELEAARQEAADAARAEQEAKDKLQLDALQRRLEWAELPWYKKIGKKPPVDPGQGEG